MSIIITRSDLAVNDSKFTYRNIKKVYDAFNNIYKDDELTDNHNNYLSVTTKLIVYKKVPDMEDCIILTRGLNNWCSEEDAEKIVTEFLRKYPERGIIGCYCDLCKILNQDLPLGGKAFSELLDKLEDTINDNVKQESGESAFSNWFMQAIEKAKANENSLDNIKEDIAKVGNTDKEEVPTNNIIPDNKEVTE